MGRNFKTCFYNFFYTKDNLKMSRKLDDHVYTQNHLKTNEVSNKKGVIFLIHSAGLEVAKIGKNYQLLNHVDHEAYLIANDRDPSKYRPDTIYHVLMTILDSPLNLTGNIGSIYIQTVKNLLICISPQLRLPQTMKEFYEVLTKLIQNGSVRLMKRRNKLLKIVRGPVSEYLPTKCLKIGLSPLAPELVHLGCFVETLHNRVTLAFNIIMGRNNEIHVPCEQWLSISSYSLSAVSCLNRIIAT